VTFNYGSIKWTYTPQKSNGGGKGGDVTGGWDIGKNKKV
jgi:type VI protein secretion system component Hcp